MVVTARGCVRTLDELLDRAQVDLSTWRVERYVANAWTTPLSEGRVGQMHQVKAWLARVWPAEVRPVEPVRPLQRRKPVVQRGTVERALIIPDSQNGCWWSQKRDKLYPLHDRRAWDLAVQVAQLLQPQHIVLLGDMLDLAVWTKKYLRQPTHRFTTQPAVDELHWWIAQLRLACPEARIVYLEGNHEARANVLLVSQLAELADMQVVTVPKLLALDQLDVEYSGPYDSEYWLWEVRVHHGEIVRKRGGQTVGAAFMDDTSYSQVFGHIHRHELAWNTIHGPRGPQQIFALSPGTITRIEPGVVPAFKRRNNWQQGLALLEREHGEVWPTLLPIIDGRTRLRGLTLVGQDRSDEIAEATGWQAFALAV